MGFTMEVCVLLFTILCLSNCMGEICRDAYSGDDTTDKNISFSCPRLFEGEQNTVCCGNFSLHTYCCSNSTLTAYDRTNSTDYPRNVVTAKVIVGLYGVIVLALMVVDWCSHRRIQKLKKSEKAKD